jgi:hypothetical protein
VVSRLIRQTNSALVRINYRLGPSRQYPSPLHDVLNGYDHILSEVLPSIAQSERQSDDAPASISLARSRIAVYGRLLGGSLATALALTECRLGMTRIRAAAVTDPVVDWPTVLDGSSFYASPNTSRERSRGSNTPHSADEDAVLADMASAIQLEQSKIPEGMTDDLQDPFISTPAHDVPEENIRLIDEADPLHTLPDPRLLFRRPEDTTDSFASPLLFFRTAHLEFGSRMHSVALPALDPNADSESMDEPFSENDQSALDGTASSHAVLDELTKDIPMGRGPHPRRRSHRVHPPTDSALPAFHVTLSNVDPVLRRQGEEFVRLARRSIARRWVKDRIGKGWADEEPLPDMDSPESFEDLGQRRKEARSSLARAGEKIAAQKVAVRLEDEDQELGTEDAIYWLRKEMEGKT